MNGQLIIILLFFFAGYVMGKKKGYVCGFSKGVAFNQLEVRRESFEKGYCILCQSHSALSTIVKRNGKETMMPDHGWIENKP